MKPGGQAPEKIRQVQELRRSGAHGVHGKRRVDRQNNRRKAIEESKRDG